MARCVDLNCDCGEGSGSDSALVPLVTSVNIACGAHAGDDETMRATSVLAQAHGVAIGAHPGYADRANFGRDELPQSAAELTRLVTGQLDALARQTAFTHVKPHGALYNLAARDPAVARVIARAIRVFDPALLVYGLAGSVSLREATEVGLAVVHEAFADRTYQGDGSLTPRSRPDALISNEEEAVGQALRMVLEGIVRATDGSEVAIRADSICLHGDGAQAVAFAHRLREALRENGVEVRALPPPRF